MCAPESAAARTPPASPDGPGFPRRWRQPVARRHHLNWKPFRVEGDAERAHSAGSPALPRKAEAGASAAPHFPLSSTLNSLGSSGAVRGRPRARSKRVENCLTILLAQQFSLWPRQCPPGEGTRPTPSTKPCCCRPGALTRHPFAAHNENCCSLLMSARR